MSKKKLSEIEASKNNRNFSRTGTRPTIFVCVLAIAFSLSVVSVQPHLAYGDDGHLEVSDAMVDDHAEKEIMNPESTTVLAQSLPSEHVAGEEESEGSEHGHGSEFATAALWAGVATVFAPASILGINKRIRGGGSRYIAIIGILSVGAGIVHILLVPDHVSENLNYGIFFIVSGLAQIAFGLLFVAKPLRKLAVAGILGNAGMIALYIVTRSVELPAPFTGVEEVDAVGIITLLIELSLVGLLSYRMLATRKLKHLQIASVTQND